MKHKYYDIIGAYAALLCLIHCMAAPMLFLLPLGLSHNPFIDFVFLSIGIYPVFKVARSKVPFYLKALLTISYLTVVAAVLLENLFHKETVLIYLGAAGLITGHLINYNNHKH